MINDEYESNTLFLIQHPSFRKTLQKSKVSRNYAAF